MELPRPGDSNPGSERPYGTSNQPDARQPRAGTGGHPGDRKAPCARSTWRFHLRDAACTPGLHAATQEPLSDARNKTRGIRRYDETCSTWECRSAKLNRHYRWHYGGEAGLEQTAHIPRYGSRWFTTSRTWFRLQPDSRLKLWVTKYTGLT